MDGAIERTVLEDGDIDYRKPKPQSRVPLFLLPREEADQNRHQYKISGCFIHEATNAYLFDSADAAMMEDMMGVRVLDMPVVDNIVSGVTSFCC